MVAAPSPSFTKYAVESNCMLAPTCVQGENLDELALLSLAIALMIWVRDRAGEMVTVKLALPLPSVVTVVMPTKMPSLDVSQVVSGKREFGACEFGKSV